MSNFFQEVLADAKSVEQEILGPDYEYWKQIKSPSEMGMSTNGSISTIASDVAGLINYVELLVTGTGGASKTGGPLGNKFFLKTPATCKDKASGEIVDRYKGTYVEEVLDMFRAPFTRSRLIVKQPGAYILPHIDCIS